MTIGKIKPLGKILIEKELITNENLREALLFQETSSQKLGQILIRKGYLDLVGLHESLALQYGIDFVSYLEFDDALNLFKSIPLHFMRTNRIVPYRSNDSNIYIAISDVLNFQPIDDLKIMFSEYNILISLSTDAEITRIINSHFELIESETTNEIIEDLEESDFEIISVIETDDIMDLANEAPIIRLVNTIIRQAVNDRASDIHFEVFEKDIVVRFRIDGVLYKMFTPPKRYQDAVISRIKIMSNLNIAENRLPQDGRIELKIGGKEIDIRVSVFPTHYGERIVLRLLNKSDINFNMESLGFSESVLKNYDELITIPHGIILVTGPTGSGKSTTLYSVLNRLNSEDVNILTVEDPIEYQIYGVGQMQVKTKVGLTFSTGLRSILRQDPDIIMIGEIRDRETAEIAVQAALTGHRVFSTLHTNDAASGITRLVDMGIEPYLISSSVNAFLAQRLVRKICPHCIEGYKPMAKELERAGISKALLKEGKLYRGRGCERCLNTGYSGRLGIFELLVLSDSIRKLIMAREDSFKIKEYALSEGMISLNDDGIKKAIAGLTTLEEVMRVS